MKGMTKEDRAAARPVNLIRDLFITNETPLHVMLTTMRVYYKKGYDQISQTVLSERDLLIASQIAEKCAPYIHAKAAPVDLPTTEKALDDTIEAEYRDVTPAAMTTEQIFARLRDAGLPDEIIKQIAHR